MSDPPDSTQQPPLADQWLATYTPPGPPDIDPNGAKLEDDDSELLADPHAEYTARLFASFPEGELVIKRDDGIVTELLGVLHDDLNPGVRFSPAQWAETRRHTDCVALPHIKNSFAPSSLNGHHGPMYYFGSTVVYHLNVTIGETESLWSNGITSSPWMLTLQRGGITGSAAIVRCRVRRHSKGDRNGVKEPHVESDFTDLLPNNQDQMQLAFRDGVLQNPPNGHVHETMKALFTEVLRESHMNNRVWAMIMLFNVRLS
ncbi:hypothetical protein IAR50_000574 [Cryptococcus sp. DSM 104548]